MYGEGLRVEGRGRGGGEGMGGRGPGMSAAGMFG